jgi:hypothetical protein
MDAEHLLAENPPAVMAGVDCNREGPAADDDLVLEERRLTKRVDTGQRVVAREVVAEWLARVLAEESSRGPIVEAGPEVPEAREVVELA